MTDVQSRCRLVLIVPETEDASVLAGSVEDALKGGDVASVIVPQYGLSETDFQKHCEVLVPIIQSAGAAAIIAGDSRVAGRSKADGLHIVGSVHDLADAVEKHTPKMIVGAGSVSNRHTALEIGEIGPDYVFFGKVGGDIKPEAHPKNLDLGEWWAAMVEIPCIIMGGTDPSSALAVAETGAEFVALSKAVFSSEKGAALVVAEVNALLDQKAPRFEDL